MISAESLFGASFRRGDVKEDEEESGDEGEACNPLKFLDVQQRISLAQSMGNGIKEEESGEDNEGSFNDNNSDSMRREVGDDSAEASNEGSFKNIADALKKENGHRTSFDQDSFSQSAIKLNNLFLSASGLACEARGSGVMNGAGFSINNGNNDSIFSVNNETLNILPNKKKRQRRNPVWPYFDVSDGIASCKQCSYTTKSVFSTNLKVHLRTHHNATYKLVIEAEEQQHAALQKTLATPPAKQAFANVPILPKLPASALSLSMGTSGNRDISLGQILGRMLDMNAARESSAGSKSGTPSAPVTPVSSTGENDVFESPSTSDYDLTYSTLLNGGRIDESCLPGINQSTCLSKRRRLRRHPVWRFFKDVDGTKSVGCVKCSFNTASPFSTNLKMHLKAHHKDDYTLVLKLEAQQREEEGIRENSFPVAAGIKRKYSTDDAPGEVDVNLKKALEQPPPKKKLSLFDVADEETLMAMSTSERLAAMVELAAGTNEEEEKDDEQPTTSESGSVTEAEVTNPLNGLDTAQASLLARFNLSGADLLQSSPLLQKNTILGQAAAANGYSPARPQFSNSPQDASKSVRTVSKKLPTGEIVKVRMMRKDVHASQKEECNNGTANSPTKRPSPLNLVASSKTDAPTDATATFSVARSANEHLAISAINAKGFVKPSDSRVAKDEALARFMAKSKAFHFLGMPEFKNFVQTLCPDYQLPSSGSLKRLAETLKM